MLSTTEVLICLVLEHIQKLFLPLGIILSNRLPCFKTNEIEPYPMCTHHVFSKEAQQPFVYLRLSLEFSEWNLGLLPIQLTTEVARSRSPRHVGMSKLHFASNGPQSKVSLRWVLLSLPNVPRDHLDFKRYSHIQSTCHMS